MRYFYYPWHGLHFIEAPKSDPQMTDGSLCALWQLFKNLSRLAFQVMASDGLWDAVSNDDVVSIIRDTVKEPGMCSKRLATEAAARGSKDNITVIVVFLHPVSTAERVY